MQKKQTNLQTNTKTLQKIGQLLDITGALVSKVKVTWAAFVVAPRHVETPIHREGTLWKTIKAETKGRLNSCEVRFNLGNSLWLEA